MDNQLEVSNLLTPIVAAYKTLSDETKELFKVGLSEYLQNQTEKYYFTNTFIHKGDNKIRFNDFYYPIKARYQKLTTDFSQLEEVFEEYKKITIVGSAGSGKTTLIKYIYLNTLFGKNKIPILLELRSLNDFNGDFESLIFQKVLKLQLKPNKEIFERALRNGQFLFLLDGYDEIYSIKKNDIIRQIDLFVDTYSNNYFLMTTRPGSGIECFARFYDFKICALSNDDVKGFIDKIVEDKERSERIKQIFTSRENSNYMEFLRNPLLLSMFIMAFENHPEIPSKKSSFYRNVFDTLYSKHDGVTKNSYPREKITKLQRDNFEEILSIFSYISLLEGQYTFTHEYLTDTLNKVKSLVESKFNTEDLIYDLVTSISILILDGLEYNFPHRSLQEYFTAFFISKLPTDKKSIAYENLLKKLEEASNDFSNNFWSLCYELDESIFIQSFLLPKLKEIYDLIKDKEGLVLTESLLQILDPFVLELFINKKKELFIHKNISVENAVMSFCKIDYSDIFTHPGSLTKQKALREVYMTELYNARQRTKNEYYTLRLLDMDDKSILKILLINDGLIKKMGKYRDNLFKKIEEFESKVERKKSNIDILLGK